MAKITFAEQTYDCLPNENVLDCLFRHQVVLPSSCRAGVCQTCMMKTTTGKVPEAAQAGLRPGLQKRGYFMACACIPEEDITIAMPDDGSHEQISAEVIEKFPLNKDIVCLRLRPDITLEFEAGQFVNVHRPDGLVRSYSIASLPSDGCIELHVEKIPDGQMSGWLHDFLAEGDSITLDGSYGECCYSSDDSNETLLLVGTGSGLAPLWGIARDALLRGHQGEIYLYHGVRTADRLYLSEELRVLEQQHANFHYIACLSGEEGISDTEAGRADAIALQQHPKFDASWHLYLCGNPEMVSNMKKKGFLAGASLNKIHADPFEITQ